MTSRAAMGRVSKPSVCLLRRRVPKRVDPDSCWMPPKVDIHCKNVQSFKGIGALFKRRRWRGRLVSSRCRCRPEQLASRRGQPADPATLATPSLRQRRAMASLRNTEATTRLRDET